MMLIMLIAFQFHNNIDSITISLPHKQLIKKDKD